jgi:hypothetical protein
MNRIKRSTWFIALFLLGFLWLPGRSAQAAETDWQSFSANLAKALASPNHGLQQSALAQIIHYGDRLDMDAAIFDIVRIYRSHQDARVRMMALAALHKTQNHWAMEFLRRSTRFETSPKLLAALEAILNDYDNNSP